MDAPYLLLKTSQRLFGKGPRALEPEQLEKARGLAARQFNLESLVLASPEARSVFVPPATLASAIDEIRARYEDETAFLDDLTGNGLNLDEFTAALERELKVDAVLEKISARAAQVSDIDVELYYHYHPEQFRQPEVRRARHILVTINDAYPENTRANARERIEAIAARLAKDPGRFEEQAMKHSECPTSMHGGLLGDVTPGKLFKPLEDCLFALAPGQMSGIVESELGFHILLCESVQAARELPLQHVRPIVRQQLEARRKRLCQQAWIKSLRAGPALT